MVKTTTLFICTLAFLLVASESYGEPKKARPSGKSSSKIEKDLSAASNASNPTETAAELITEKGIDLRTRTTAALGNQTAFFGRVVMRAAAGREIPTSLTPDQDGFTKEEVDTFNALPDAGKKNLAKISAEIGTEIFREKTNKEYTIPYLHEGTKKTLVVDIQRISSHVGALEDPDPKTSKVARRDVLARGLKRIVKKLETDPESSQFNWEDEEHLQSLLTQIEGGYRLDAIFPKPDPLHSSGGLPSREADGDEKSKSTENDTYPTQ